MYKFDCPLPRYVYPWLLTFAERIRLLNDNRVRVGYFYSRTDNSTFRYRVFNAVEALNLHSKSISASWFTYADIAKADEIIASIDKLVIVRVPYTLSLRELIRKAKLRGIEVIFDTDDLVFDVDAIPSVMEALGQSLSYDGPWDSWYAYIGRVSSTINLCDRAFASTVPLSNEIINRKSLQTSVIRNSLNLDQLEVSARLFAAKVRRQFATDRYTHIGYFSGSPTHMRDFSVAAGAIADVMDDEPLVKLRLVGHIGIPSELDRHRERIEVHDFTDYVGLQALIAATEINIAPLRFGVFTNCKSELKYFEAAAVGSLTIASDTQPFVNAIEDGVDGLISREFSWASSLRRALEIVRNPIEQQKIVTLSRTRVVEKYGPFALAKAAESALLGSSS